MKKLSNSFGSCLDRFRQTPGTHSWTKKSRFSWGGKAGPVKNKCLRIYGETIILFKGCKTSICCQEPQGKEYFIISQSGSSQKSLWLIRRRAEICNNSPFLFQVLWPGLREYLNLNLGGLASLALDRPCRVSARQGEPSTRRPRSGELMWPKISSASTAIRIPMKRPGHSSWWWAIACLKNNFISFSL